VEVDGGLREEKVEARDPNATGEKESANAGKEAFEAGVHKIGVRGGGRRRGR
jgi:hypothetical protein